VRNTLSLRLMIFCRNGQSRTREQFEGSDGRSEPHREDSRMTSSCRQRCNETG
jgi:hypothetical protein